MTRRTKLIPALAIILALLYGTALAGPVSFRANGHTFTAEIPDEYLLYTAEMGVDSPLLKLTHASVAEMEVYMSGLGCSVCGAHSAKYHQLWLSVKDRSRGLGTVKAGGSLPPHTLRGYYDGASVVLGPYTVETVNGIDYYVFANSTSIVPGGKKYYISTFIGHYEVSVRWESGTGTVTDGDIAQLMGIITSVAMAD